MLELLQVRFTNFAEVFGMNIIANDRYAFLKLAEKHKKLQLTESQKILKPKYKLSGGPVATFSFPERGNLSHTPCQLCHCNNYHFK